jgi:hypothetical protein
MWQSNIAIHKTANSSNIQSYDPQQTGSTLTYLQNSTSLLDYDLTLCKYNISNIQFVGLEHKNKMETFKVSDEITGKSRWEICAAGK